MARSLHESEAMNKIYQRLDPENVRKTVFAAAKLRFRTKVNRKRGSMTLSEILKLIRYAHKKLERIRSVARDDRKREN
jgi:hypothetical protein